jgi:hypothetical protein|tara:strand:- start:3082 stop:3249 length:168 start_codon:yes stop_codon:yes gene_type:complete
VCGTAIRINTHVVSSLRHSWVRKQFERCAVAHQRSGKHQLRLGGRETMPFQFQEE